MSKSSETRTYTRAEVDQMRASLEAEWLDRERIRMNRPDLTWEYVNFGAVEGILRTYIAAGVEPFGTA